MLRRNLALAGVTLPLLVSACARVEAVNFQDPQTGKIEAVCGPYLGLAEAIAEAHEGCIDAYEGSGWKRAPG